MRFWRDGRWKMSWIWGLGIKGEGYPSRQAEIAQLRTFEELDNITSGCAAPCLRGRRNVTASWGATKMEYAFGFFTMIAGSLLGIYLSRLAEWRETAKSGSICGDWYSISHGGDHSLVQDKIIIKRKGLRLYFINEGNNQGYQFDGYLHIKGNNTVVGNWRSRRPGSTAGGQILMHVNPQGTSICGFYGGSALDGKQLLLGWTLSRNSTDKGQMIKQLRSTTAFPQ